MAVTEVDRNTSATMSDAVPNTPTAASLLTLSMAAESAVPIPIKHPRSDSTVSTRAHRKQIASSPRHSRRLSSELVAQRLSPSSIQPSSVGSLGVGSLSLSSSPGAVSTSVGSSHGGTERKKGGGSTPIPIGKPGKKRGHDYKCETCAKIYRHPSCLIKHRWEHTSHWRESSKYVLSKHQQVQLLEAAAILSHLSPESKTGTSLPEDRSLWPCFLSNGTLPPPQGVELPPSMVQPTLGVSNSQERKIGAVSSSAPPANGARGHHTGPRLHDYNIPIPIPENAAASATDTTASARLVGIPTGSSSGAVATGAVYREHTPAVSESWMSASSTSPHRWSSSDYHHHHPDAGLSLPHSSVRSDSGGSVSEDEDELEEDDDAGSVVDIDIDDSEIGVVGRGSKDRLWKVDEDFDEVEGQEAAQYFGRQHRVEKQVIREEEEWNGMEMDMDMD